MCNKIKFEFIELNKPSFSAINNLNKIAYEIMLKTKNEKNDIETISA